MHLGLGDMEPVIDGTDQFGPIGFAVYATCLFTGSRQGIGLTGNQIFIQFLSGEEIGADDKHLCP